MRNIRKYRAEKGYTQKQLATELGVSRQTVVCMENNKSYRLSEKNARKLARIFNCGVYDLCTFDEALMYKPLTESDREKINALKEINF